MKTLFSFALFMNFIAIGIWLGTGRKRLSASLWMRVFAGLFVLHLALGFILRAYPALVDPREGHNDADTVKPSN